MDSKKLWLASMWPSVRSWLPAPPATVVELGCGSLGGFVPMLNAEGYNAMGTDPAAPEGPAYQRVEFERAELPAQVDVFIACTSLHHVDDPSAVLDRARGALAAGGLMIVVEWDWEAFDEHTARWCLGRSVHVDGWLSRRLDAGGASGRPWQTSFREWAAEHGLHSARELVDELDERFQRVVLRRGPFLFPELADTTEGDEQRAIDEGKIPALRIDYVGVAHL